MSMFSITQRIIGRYIECNGQTKVEGDLTVSITRVYNGKDPFEVLIKRKYEDSKGPAVIQRIVLDVVKPNVSQGQNIGRHGEPGTMETFTDKKIKDCALKCDRNDIKVYIQEFKYPSSLVDIKKREMMFTSVYSFLLNEDGGMYLELQVADAEGKNIKMENFRRVDCIQRNYSVTFDKSSR